MLTDRQDTRKTEAQNRSKMEPSTENTEEASAFAEAVESSKFKTIGDIAFYRRQKKLLPGNSPYRALLDTLELSDCRAKLQLLNEENKVPLFVEVFALKDHVIRIKVNELKPMKPRYEVPDVIINEPVAQRLTLVSKDGLSVTLTTVDGGTQVLIIAKPFRMDVRDRGEMSVSVNSLGLLYFEHLRKRSQSEVCLLWVNNLEPLYTWPWMNDGDATWKFSIQGGPEEETDCLIHIT